MTRRLFRNLIVRASARPRIQRLLEWNVVASEYLMGIGSGAGPQGSGEGVLVDKLKAVIGHGEEPLCIFDVGSNRGQFIDLLDGGLQGIPFHVHAFEPSRTAYDALRRSVKHLPNVTVNNIALGKRPGTGKLFYDREGSEIASLYKRKLDHFGVQFAESETVTIETLDAYCASHSVERIDLLKLDVEGHELEVLHGGMRMLGQRRVRMTSFEFGGCNIDSRTFFRDFYYFLKEIGMGRIFRIVPPRHVEPIAEYKEIYEQFRTTNFLAVADGERALSAT